MSTETSVSGIQIYPIKSAGGISLDLATVEERGFRYDRRWMVVDGDNRFFTQREHPRLALIRVRLEPEVLVVDAPDMPSLKVPLHPTAGKPVPATVWDDVVESLPVGEEAAYWFSEFLGTPCSLMYLPDESVRPVDPDYSLSGDQVSLADGFPFLLISEASLDDLNSRMDEPLPMDRFRPNIVVRGCEAFAEDDWRRVRIGSVIFRIVKPCSRCVTTTVDQASAATGKEPLRTLATYRKAGSKVLFGQNLIQDSAGTVSLDDEVRILPG